MSRTIAQVEQDYIKAILTNDTLRIKQMYREFLPMVEQFVVRNSGTRSDAQDVLQDGLMVVFEKTNQAGFELTSTFKTYLFSICKFIWLKKLRKNRS